MGNIYLLAYNTALCGAWAYVLYLTIEVVLSKGGPADVWKVTEQPLKWAQTAAVMEVIHSAAGIVRSPVAITAMQVASRLWVLWGIIVLDVPTTTNGGITLGEVSGVKLELSLITLLVAWCLSEVIRYSFYGFKELLGYVPYPSLWLRYTGFIVLYPLGVASELTMAYLALPKIKREKLLSFSMPNTYNFAFDYYRVCLAVCASYVYGLPTLYNYMLVQRKKQLGPGERSKVKQT